ncbi:CvpA family protein [bacterium]|nr:CvpA family protein [bacterium]
MANALHIHLLVAALAAAILLGLFHGLRGGLLRSAFKLAGLVAGVVLARPLAASLGPHLSSAFDFLGGRLLLVLLCFVAIASAFSLVGWLLALSLRWTPLVWLDRAGGALFGVGIGLIVAGVLLGLLEQVGLASPLIAGATGWEGRFLRGIAALTPTLFGGLERLGGPALLPPGAV